MGRMLEQLISGILTGILYSVVAMGFSLIFGAMGVIDLAFGEYLMLGGYGAFFLMGVWGIHASIVFPIIFVIFLGFGSLIYKVIGKRVVDEPILYSLFATFGFSLVLKDLAAYFFTADFRSLQLPYLSGRVQFLGATYGLASIFTAILGALFIGALLLFFRETRYGKGIRAVSEELHLSRAAGINADRIRTISYGIGITMCALAGCLLALNFPLYPTVGQGLHGLIFGIVILGGLGSLPGAAIGGLIVGLLESYTVKFFSPTMSSLAMFILVMLILCVRPTGLFGKEE